MGYSKRRSEQEWSDLIEAQFQSGQSIKLFCEVHQLKVGTFYYWRSRLSDSAQSEQGSGFIAIEPKGLSTASLILRYGSGLSLELPVDYPLEALSKLIKQLEC